MKSMKNTKSEEGKAKASIDNKHSMLELAGGSLMLATLQCTTMVLSNNTLADQKKHDDCLSDHAETLVNHSHRGRLLLAPSMLPQGNQTAVCSGPCADSCDSLLVDKALVFFCGQIQSLEYQPVANSVGETFLGSWFTVWKRN